MKLSISIKLVFISVLITCAVLAPALYVAENLIESSALQKEEQINLDYAAARANEIESLIGIVVERTHVVGASIWREEKSAGGSTLDGGLIEFGKDGDSVDSLDKSLLSVSVLSSDGRIVGRRTNEDLVRTLCRCQSVDGVLNRALSEFPLDEVKNGEIQVENVLRAEGLPAFVVGVPLARDPSGKISHVAIGYVNIGALQKPLSESGNRIYYVVDREGNLLAHSDESLTLSRGSGQRVKLQDFTTTEILGMVSDRQSLPRAQKRMITASGRYAFVAYGKTNYGLSVVSEANEGSMRDATNRIRRQFLLIGGLALAFALFLALYFSASLSSAIISMARMAKSVTGGNFRLQAYRGGVLFKDEVTELAEAFDVMNESLRERDKVKGVFAKFHGSQVTEDMLKNQMGAGGQRKDVIVLYADIRGFDTASDKAGADQILEMLNEYFGVMVGVINLHGGVVDKLMGDGVLAVWGLPRASSRDAQNAVMACLKIREALQLLNEKRVRKGKQPIFIGMALHSGKAISGVVGSAERMEYTVMGGILREVEKIEASTEFFGLDFLISEDVLDKIGDEFVSDMVGTVHLKGRAEPAKVHAVKGYLTSGGKAVEIKTEYSVFHPTFWEKMSASGVRSKRRSA